MSEDNKPLSDQEQAFVDAYLASRFNASEAARRAYNCASDTSARALGYQVRGRSHVAAEIARRLQAHTLGAEEVLSLLSDHARADLSAFLTLDAEGVPGFDLGALRKAGLGHLVKEVRVGKDGVTYRFHDAQAALDRLARVHGLYQDKVEVSGTLGIEDVAGLAAQVRARLTAGGEGGDG